MRTIYEKDDVFPVTPEESQCREINSEEKTNRMTGVGYPLIKHNSK